MRIRMRFVVAACFAGMLAMAAPALANHWDDAGEFDVADVLVEINATDGDAGFQGKVDAEAWRKVGLRAPKEAGSHRRKLFGFSLGSTARQQGFTEFVWESAEPEFSEFGLAEFLERFPEGEYRFRARTIDGGRLQSFAELTHQLPAGPVITSPEEGAGVPSGSDLVVTWDAVTTTFAVDDPEGEGTPELESDVVRYIVVVEFEDEDEEIKEELVIDLQVLPGDDSESFSATIPGAFLSFADSEGYKVEVGVVEESGNRTFSELPFCTDAPCPEEEDED